MPGRNAAYSYVSRKRETICQKNERRNVWIFC